MKNKVFYEEMKRQEQEKRSLGNESTADLYRAVRNHFKSFNGGRKLSLKAVTPTMVHNFQDWLRKKGLRVNSVNSYLSNFRAMYNRACLGWKGRPSESPFAGICLKREDTQKRAVPVDVIKNIASVDLKDEPEKQQAADVALFAFMAWGMPFVDIVHLTQDNLIEGGKVLSYRRQKTNVLIQMEVSPGMQLLVDRYSRPDTPYLFPILPEGASHEQYKYCLATENRYLDQIRIELGLVDPLTTYVFRHAWASEAYHRGIPIAIISQALGHSSEKMTSIYLTAFDADKVGEANSLVTKGIENILRA